MSMLIKQYIFDIEASGLFDSDWYLAKYQDVGILGIGAAEHYLRIGARLLRDPSPCFSTAFYLASHSDVARNGMHPLLHFIAHGREEGRLCLPPTPDDVLALNAATRAESKRKHARATCQTYPGRKQVCPQAKTVMVCAHVSGKHLFGGERSLLDILDGFADIGCNVVVTTPGIGNGDYLRALRDRCVAVVSFRYGWWRKNSPADEVSIATFAHLIAEHGVDAVHANTIMLREPLLAARRMGIPAVAHVRELISHDEALCNVIGETPEQIVERVLAGSDWIIANSEATGRSFLKADRTHVVPNTVDTDSFDIDAPGGSDTVNIALVSSNLPKKGLLDFVAVASLLQHDVPEARFLLIGPENDHTEFLRQAQAAGEISANVIFAGYREDAAKAMGEADILLNLSHFQESFGRTVAEAMAARRPAIAYDWGALPELVVDGCTGFVVPFKDVAAVARRLKELCEDRSKLKAMGQAARLRAVALYGKPHYAARLKTAYARIFEPSVQPLCRLTLPARNIPQEITGPLRIAYFLWHFPVPSETFVLNELRILVAQGHDVQVFCRQSPHKDFKPDFPIQWTLVQDSDSLAQKLVEAGRTMVHSHFTYPTVTEMVWPACERSKIPFTFIAHAQDIFRYSNDQKNQIGKIGRSPWCVRVIVPSRYHREYVESRGVPSHKLFINPNGVDPNLYVEGRDVARASRSKRSICAIHRFTEKKGLEHLIRAGKQLSADGISIHLYGYGDLEGDYRAMIARECLDNVFVHGSVKDRADMLEVFGQHDLFACPSVRAADGDMDGIPTVLMEAMASGLPVLTTAISGIPDLVQDEITGIVCEADADSIVEAVRRFFGMSDSQVAAIIEDAQSLIERDFHAGRLTAALLRLWRQCAVDIVIVSWKNLPQLQEVIRRLRKFTSHQFHLVVCDNGSGPDVIAYLCEEYASHDDITVVFNRDNAYVGPGTNICMEQGSSKYAVYVCGKEGFVFDYGWEKSLIEYMDADPKVGLAGTLCHSPSYLTGAQYPKAIPLFSQFRNQEFASTNPDRRFGHVQGGFFVIRRAMYDAIGGFSDDVPHDYTDVEYSYHAESQGWKLGTPPRLLALFNKTRPGLISRVDESVAALHPPMLGDLPLLDRVSRREVVLCNLCGWHGQAFVMKNGLNLCAGCGSRPADRTLYRFLAESMLTFRRLPALGINVGEAMAPIWHQQFQGQILSGSGLREHLLQHGRLDLNSKSRKLVFFDGTPDGDFSDMLVLRELGRILAHDGMMLFKLKNSATAKYPDPLTIVADACSLQDIARVRFSSCVVRYDSAPLFVGRRVEEAQCVS